MDDARILVLGCGKKPRDGAVNHDLFKHAPHVDVAHDLNVLPWPWEDEEFDTVIASSVLEHLHIDRLAIMAEVWRITKPGGLAWIKLPYWNAEISHADMTHRWFASLQLMDQLDPDTKRGQQYDFYTPFKWKIIEKRYSSEARTSIIFKLIKRPPEEEDHAES